MITFGYRNRINGPMRALVALAVGTVMVLKPETALTLVVKIIAAFILASGLVSLVVGILQKKNGTLPLMSFNAVVDILIGLVLFMFPEPVARFIIYLIGFALLVFGLLQLVTLASARRVMNMGMGILVMPALVTVIGGVLLFNPFAPAVMVMIAGASLIVYGASELLSSWKMRKVMKDYTDRPDDQVAEVIENEDTVDEQ